EEPGLGRVNNHTAHSIDPFEHFDVFVSVKRPSTISQLGIEDPDSLERFAAKREITSAKTEFRRPISSFVVFADCFSQQPQKIVGQPVWPGLRPFELDLSANAQSLGPP